MADLTHFIEARVLPLDGAAPSRGDTAHVISLLMDAVHKQIADGSVLAVAFPESAISNASHRNDVIRVFGDVSAVTALLVNKSFAGLVAGGAISLGKVPVRSVPDSVTSWVSYARDRSPDKACAGWAIRTDRRFRKRSEKAEVADNRLKELLDRAELKRIPLFVNVASSSTGQRFRLFIVERVAGGPGPGTFNSYGLANSGSAVPSF